MSKVGWCQFRKDHTSHPPPGHKYWNNFEYLTWVYTTTCIIQIPLLLAFCIMRDKRKDSLPNGVWLRLFVWGLTYIKLQVANKYTDNTRELTLFQHRHYKLSCPVICCGIFGGIEVPVNPLYAYLSRGVNLIIYFQ